MKGFIFKYLFLSLLFLPFQLLAGISHDKIRVACIGNSITYGYGIADRFINSYPGILQQWLGQDYEVRNFGYSSRTLLNKGDYPYMHEQLYRYAKAFLPDIVTIKLGTNDSKPENWKYKADFQKDLETMVDEFKALESHPRIYLCYPIPVNKVQWGINDSVINHHILPIIKKVAKRKNVELIDLYHALKPYPQYLTDGVHPNSDGSALIAKTIYEKITGKEAPVHHSGQPFPGKKTTWNGCDRYDFFCYGRAATVVVPKKVATGRPWIWRPAFFGAFPSVDKALLDKGFHIAYLDVTHLYGSPRSVRMGNEFYQVMTQFYHLSKKVVVEGFSRGGYFAFNWAAANPEKVACLYVDAPVCDLTSWPGRQRKAFWNDMLQEWGIKNTDVTPAFRGNALQVLPKLAAAKIPIISVCGEDDKTVPYKDNFKKVRDAYASMGGVVELILKPDCDHHPHSLQDPEPVVDFILRYQSGYDHYQRINFRTLPCNAFTRFEKEKKGCVAFFGGSITYMRGWRNQIQEDLKQRFPDTDFTFIDSGIGSTGSTPHAFRLEQDVLKKGMPDLIFFEAAVNDDTNGFTATQQVRAMEGIVRHFRRVNPNVDLVMLHFIHEPFIPLLKKKIQPDVIMNHERVANAYSITSINLADEIVLRLQDGQLTWKEFGGVHPSWLGHKFYTATINRLFDVTQSSMKNHVPQGHELPIRKLDAFCYDQGHFVDINKAKRLKGFSIKDDWMPSVYKKAQLRDGFYHVPMLECSKGGASFQLEFTGRAIGIFCVTGPGAGVLEYKIDNGEFRELNMYTRWSHYLYLPWVYLLESELQEGRHLLTVRMKKGMRTECQIRNFVVNN